MIKNTLLYLLILLFCFSCDDSNGPNDIRHTSMHDYYANYIFDLDNNLSALKTINDFALNGIEKHKHVVDSLKASGYKNVVSQNKFKINTYLSVNAEDIIIYTPPSEFTFKPVDEKDIVAEYIVGDESFKVEHIKIGERYATGTISIKETLTENKCILKLSTDTLNLEVLYQILKKTEILAYQKKHLDFKYTVSNNKNIKLLEVTYSNNGKHIMLNYL